MRCRTCDYPLWNLITRVCPECGSDYLPSDFAFVPNTVEFCCPHCEQVYFGGSESGHPEPIGFECHSCNTCISMDEMLLRPRAGKTEYDTKADRLPWRAREKMGFFKGWWKTVVLALSSPHELAQSMNDRVSVPESLLFLATSMLNALFISLISLALVIIVYITFENQSISMIDFSGVVRIIINTILKVTILSGIHVVIWSIITQLILSNTGGTRLGLEATIECFAYASGAVIIIAVPIVGVFFAPIAIFWWWISAGMILKTRSEVSGIRSLIVTFIAMVLSIVLTFTVYTLYEGRFFF